MPRRSRINWPLNIGIVCFFGAMAIYIAWPMIGFFMGWEVAETDSFGLPPDPGAIARDRAMTLLAGSWFFVLGASIGSFLNVVAYRMPMGLTFVSKPSRCPFCETPILAQHNVPILGWLTLRGRCNACRLPISSRYIFVEIAVGTLFLTLFLAEIASGGQSLPIREPNSRTGVMWNLFTPQYDLIGIYAYHAFLLAILATVSLMKLDRFRVPRRFAFFTLAMGVALRWVWPELSVLPMPDWLADSLSSWLETLPLLDRFVRVLLDLAIGGVLGWIVQLAIAFAAGRRLSPSRDVSMFVVSLIAVYCGWQAVVPVLLIASFVQLLFTLFGRASGGDASWLWGMAYLAGAWLTLCFWRQLPSVWFPGAETPLQYQLVAIALGLAAVAIAAAIQPARTREL